MEELEITSYDENEVPEKIEFDQMEKLTLKLYSNFGNKWIDFISNQVNSKVNTFKVDAKNLTKDQLLTIPDKLTELKIVSVKSYSKYAAQDIVNFVKKIKHLDTLELYVGMEDSQRDELKNTLDKDWTVEIVPIGGLAERVVIHIGR